jgi:hypothetical protein
MTNSIAASLLSQETRGMLARLARVKPFALQETMLPAAAISTAAQTAIEYYLARRRRRLRAELKAFVGWLASAAGSAAAL